MPRNKPVVYITFDDGPHPEITPWVIKELDEVNAKATFFVVGANAAKHPEVVQRLQHEGHAVGNHTYHHIKGWNSSLQEYLTDIDRCEEVIGKTEWFRPPYGRISSDAIPAITKKYKIAMWDVLSRDYNPNLNPQRALSYIKRATRNGSIVVFHDSEKAFPNLKVILPEYLQFLRSEGYDLKVL